MEARSPLAVSHGILTSAFGARKYVELAVDLGLSVRATSKLPIALLTSPTGARLITQHYPGVFDRLVVLHLLDSLKPTAALVAAKLESIKNSPYEHTIFLDSDMLCRADPAFLLENVGADDFRIFGRLHRDRSTCSHIIHHGIRVSQLFDTFNLDSYVHCSLAAFAFGKGGGVRVAERMESEQPLWRERTKALRESMPSEILFGLLGDRTGVAFYDLPGRFYQKQDLGFRWSDEVTCIHSAPMRHKEALLLMAGVVSRRRRGGYPVGPSLYWVSEILNRRAEQFGLSRRQANVVRTVNNYLFEAR